LYDSIPVIARAAKDMVASLSDPARLAEIENEASEANAASAAFDHAMQSAA
jgi:hypothetical protein